MTIYVGSPNHRRSGLYALASAFIVVLMIVTAGALGYTLIAPALGYASHVSALSVAYGTVWLIALGAGLGGLWRMRRKAALERRVDGELDRLPAGHLVFCGRPWTGETAEREVKRTGYSMEAWTLTDGSGRPLGSLNADRVVLGPSGTWLITVSGRLGSREVGDRRGSCREQSLQLRAFMKAMSLRKDADPDSFAVHALLVDATSESLHDVTGGGTRPLGELARLIASAPPRLSADAYRDIAVVLASCYPASDKAVALRAVESATAA